MRIRFDDGVYEVELGDRPEGTLRERYEIYVANADDGNGGDITNNGEPLKSFDEWLGNC